jgi:hypothetical protein
MPNGELMHRSAPVVMCAFDDLILKRIHWTRSRSRWS